MPKAADATASATIKMKPLASELTGVAEVEPRAIDRHTFNEEPAAIVSLTFHDKNLLVLVR